MNLWLKFLMIIVIFISVTSFIWFLLGSTANFQRNFDIVGSVIFLIMGGPLLILTFVFSRMLLSGWKPSNGIHYSGLFFSIIVLLVLSVSLIKNTPTHGWLKERITSDSIKMTVDEKYEYRIDLINLFQRNSHARLYVKNVITGEDKNIPVDIQTSKIFGLGIKRINNWVIMEPSEDTDRYFLYTTKELGIQEDMFEIDIEAGTSEKME